MGGAPICCDNGVAANIEVFGFLLLSHFRERRPILLFLKFAPHGSIEKILDFQRLSIYP